ncbi:MAG: S8/S53 family peptidase [Rhodocyclaceae bacterium]|nr:S8/S53 family peptidase [Rhodocyclaceae bacterium]
MRYRAWAGIVAATLALGTHAATDASGIRVDDGARAIALSPAPDQPPEALMFEHAGLPVAVARRLVVRAQTEAFAARLVASGEGGVVSLLAELGDEALFLLPLEPAHDPFEAARRVSAWPEVIYAQPDLLFATRATGGQRPSYDMDGFDLARTIGLGAAWQHSVGRGVTIAVIDDGFDLSHPQFAGTALPDGVKAFSDATGSRHHGTRVAGILFGRHDGAPPEGIAPEATLLPIAARDGWTSTLVAAFALAFDSGADIISASWVIPHATRPLRDLIAHHLDPAGGGRGVLVVVSAGNSARSRFPDGLIHLPGVVPVAATDHALRPLFLDPDLTEPLCAPGMLDTVSTLPDRATEKLGASSAATPVVAGILALMRAANPLLDRRKLVEFLGSSSRPSLPLDPDRRCRVVDAGAALAAVDNPIRPADTERDRDPARSRSSPPD